MWGFESPYTSNAINYGLDLDSIGYGISANELRFSNSLV